MSASMTAPFSREYGTDTPTNAPPKLELGSGDAERDSKFQSSMSKLVSSLQESDVNSRSQKDKKEAFDALNMFAGRQMKDDNERVNINQGPAVAATAAVSTATNPQAASDMHKLLKTETAAKPLDGPKNTNQVADNAGTVSQGAEAKKDMAVRGADQLEKKANDLAAKMSPQDIAGMQPKGDSLVGPMVELGLSATGHPALAAAAGAASAMSDMQGKGTEVTKGEPSRYSGPILSAKEKKAAYVMSYGDPPAPTPAPIVAPTGPSITEMNKQMSKGPGFGADLTARTELSGQSFDGLKIPDIKSAIDNSPAMKSLKSIGLDADNTKLALLSMKDKGLVDDGGKQKLTPELQAFAKPTAPSPPGFRA